MNHPLHKLLRQSRTLAGLLCASLLLMAAPTARAQTDSGPRNLTAFGCHNVNTICYLNIDGPAIGPAGCSGNSIRWDAAGTIGKDQYALLLSAYLSGRKVQFIVSAACFAAQPGFPTFDYDFVY